MHPPCPTQDGTIRPGPSTAEITQTRELLTSLNRPRFRFCSGYASSATSGLLSLDAEHPRRQWQGPAPRADLETVSVPMPAERRRPAAETPFPRGGGAVQPEVVAEEKQGRFVLLVAVGGDSSRQARPAGDCRGYAGAVGVPGLVRVRSRGAPRTSAHREPACGTRSSCPRSDSHQGGSPRRNSVHYT